MKKTTRILNHLLQERKKLFPNPVINQPLRQALLRRKCSRPILQSNNQPTSNRNQSQDQQRISLSKGPVLLLGDSNLRGIQQRKFAPNRYVNKQTVAGGTKDRGTQRQFWEKYLFGRRFEI